MKKIIQKIFIILAIIMATSAVFNLTTTQSVSAADRTFLGLIPWDSGTGFFDSKGNPVTVNEDSLKAGIWQIAANIATDITIIAAYLVLGYVIYGGYLYIFSAGDPNKVASGKKTLTHAFIGLAIAMSAYLIMSTIRFALLGFDGQLSCNPTAGSLEASGCIDANTLVTNTLDWVYGIASVVAVVFIVYGGISYTTSAGDPSKLQKAKQVIIYALIGLAIVGLAKFITAFVSGIIQDANNQAGNTTSNIIDSNANLISKESYKHDIKTL